jgi:hypothetical protein
METIENLQHYFETDIKPTLANIEKWRKKARIKQTIKTIIFFSTIISIPLTNFLVQ